MLFHAVDNIFINFMLNSVVALVTFWLLLALVSKMLRTIFGVAVVGTGWLIGWLYGFVYYYPEIVVLILGVLMGGYLAWKEQYSQAFMTFSVMAGMSGIIFLMKKIKQRFFPASKSKEKALAGTDAPTSKYIPKDPAFTFKDVSGMSALKAQLMKARKDHETAEKNGILLTGEPGNGKTMIAEAFAGEMGWKFMPITIGDIQSKWIGQTTEQLQEVFDVAKGSGPLVLFFDECDSMLRDRGSMMGGSNDESLKTANTFLTGIGDIRRKKNIIVIAASNYPDQLDAAAIRDGRFDFKINIPDPDKEARRGLLVKFTEGLTFEDVVLERLVRRWEGFSVARIRSVAENITKNATAQGRKEVLFNDAMEALREIQGSLGGRVPEETPTLKDGRLHFDSKMRDQLVALATRLENIDEVERLGGSVPKGVIFWGPPGTGKTAVAKSLAKTSGWAFLSTTGSDLLTDNGKGFEKILLKARDLRPCIVFIDEAEQALGDRSTGSGQTTLVTNKVLAATDGTTPLHDVLFIAATNHPGQLDPAIIRGGRFSEHFEFKAPEEDTVFKMVREWIDGKRVDTPFHESFTPESAAKLLNGMSPADIRDRLQQAVDVGVCRIVSSGSELDRITIEDLKEVLA